MSVSNFCHHCAAKVLPSSKFCNQCGTSLASLSNKPEPPPSPPSRQAQATFVPFDANGQNDEDYSKYDHMDHLPKLANGLEIEIVKDNINIPKLGHIAQTIASSYIGQRDAPYAKISDKTFLEQFAQEAGNSDKK